MFSLNGKGSRAEDGAKAGYAAVKIWPIDTMVFLMVLPSANSKNSNKISCLAVWSIIEWE